MRGDRESFWLPCTIETQRRGVSSADTATQLQWFLIRAASGPHESDGVLLMFDDDFLNGTSRRWFDFRTEAETKQELRKAGAADD